MKLETREKRSLIEIAHEIVSNRLMSLFLGWIFADAALQFILQKIKEELQDKHRVYRRNISSDSNWRNIFIYIFGWDFFPIAKPFCSDLVAIFTNIQTKCIIIFNPNEMELTTFQAQAYDTSSNVKVKRIAYSNETSIFRRLFSILCAWVLAQPSSPSPSSSSSHSILAIYSNESLVWWYRQSVRDAFLNESHTIYWIFFTYVSAYMKKKKKKTISMNSNIDCNASCIQKNGIISRLCVFFCCCCCSLVIEFTTSS